MNKIIILLLLILVGCEKQETKFFEKNGKTYFQDKEGEVYIIEGTKKIRIDDYIEPYVPPFNEKLTYSNEVTWDGLNVEVDCKFRYIDDVLYECIVRDIDGINIEKTDSYNIIHNDIDTIFEVQFKTDDGFVIHSLYLIRNNIVRILDGNEVSSFKINGNFRISKDKYSMINDMNVLTYINK